MTTDNRQTTRDEAKDGGGASDHQLFITDGFTTSIAARSCVFIRRSDKAIDASKACDNAIFFMEITGAVLQSLRSALVSGYRPMFQAASDWGQASTEQAEEFQKELDAFIGVTQEVRWNV